MARVFISYSHQDEIWKDRLVSQLGVLADDGLETWNDRRIAAGDGWLPEIEQAIATCDVALLLISAPFLTSAFIKCKEVPPLLERREEQGIPVIPVILSPCQWNKVGWLKPIQARPKDGKPLRGMRKQKAEQALCDLVGEIHDLVSGPKGVATLEGGNKSAEHVRAGSSPRIDLSRLPAGAPHFLGRHDELAALDAAWAQVGRTHVVQLIAPGGTGKTSLVTRWVDRLLHSNGWGGAERVFGWSFFSQCSGEDRKASEDGFLQAALKFFGVTIHPAALPWEKGAALADVVAARRSLLILDGLEPLQYPPAGVALAGELKAPGVQTMLKKLAAHGHPGLVLVTSREHLADLECWVRNVERPEAGVILRDLGNMSNLDGARLLHELGVTRAGEAEIEPDDKELQDASQAVSGHALTLSLLGNYLKLAYDGDIRQLDRIDYGEADDEALNGHAFRLMGAYETWFKREGKRGARYLASFRLLGFFDRSASRESLRALRAAPPISGLTRPLVNLKPEHWKATLGKLQSCGLIKIEKGTGSITSHPLIREYLARKLRKAMPEAWCSGHRRIYEQLKRDTKRHRPDDLLGLQPLYQAVSHGCRAGLYQEACDEVYIDRILRGAKDDGFYSIRKLGAFGADLGAVACFFVERWQRPAPELKEDTQAWLLAVAAYCLRALGRLAEALEPMRAGAEMAVQQKDWKNAAQGYSNLSELQLSLGLVKGAWDDAVCSVGYADLSGDAFQRMSKRTARADVKHQLGEADAGREDFQAAEALQAERQPQYPLLHSLPGFRYCEFLLAPPERAAWLGNANEAAVQICRHVAQRVAQTTAWAGGLNSSLLGKALDHVTLARCALYANLIRGRPPGNEARRESDDAVSSLRHAGAQHHLPRGLLTRAWLRHALGDEPGAQADLQEAERIAARGGMKLHLADIALTRARLFHDRAALAEARRLIAECGYGRRLPELADAEAADWALPSEPDPAAGGQE